MAHITHPETSHLEEVLWNDPSDLPGINMSFRGSGKRFGPDIAHEFLETFGLKMLSGGMKASRTDITSTTIEYSQYIRVSFRITGIEN